MNNIYPQNS